jgi:hemoglobin/transferrin/lactoferrin receptor protein
MTRRRAKTPALSVVALGVALAAATGARAQGSGEGSNAASSAAVPAVAAAPSPAQTVTIFGRRIDEVLPPDRAETTLDKAQVERRMSDNLFDLLRDVPGVGMDGGPRASGMKFSLRGFDENEDVLFKIDGAVKGFEKYRFGSGVFIEPELIRAVVVERGPSVLSGSGALGGTISATTKSAIDLLRPGRSIGALAKAGYNDNTRERLRMGAVYGRPGPFDLLAALTRRDGDDIRLPEGGRLPLSATHSESLLLKVGWAVAEGLDLELGHSRYAAGPERQPYDATGGLPGVGGVVRRTIDDRNTHLRFDWQAPGAWQLRGLFSQQNTHLTDLHLAFDETGRRESQICVNPLPPTSANSVPQCTDDWRYDIRNAEVFGERRWRFASNVAVKLTLGAQWLDNRRDPRRVTVNPAVNERSFPGGFDSQLPPGDKVSRALIGEARLDWGDFSLVPGVRRDAYTVSARGGTRDNMLRGGQAPDIGFEKLQPAFGVSFQPGRGDWMFTWRWNTGFRPPLIDEYFRDASGTGVGAPSGACERTAGDPLRPGDLVTEVTYRPLYDPAGIGQPYDPARDLAPANGICGDLYRPQESINREAIVAWRGRLAGGQAGARAIAYRVHTRHLLSSLRNVGGTVGQPGVERRRGLELEADWRSPAGFATFSHARVRRSAIDDVVLGTPAEDSFQVPADTTTLSGGRRFAAAQAEAGWRVRHLAERRAFASSGTPAECIGAVGADGVTTQTGVLLHEAFASWQVTPTFFLRFAADNLTNRSYCLTSSFSGAVGFRAPGRALKLTVTGQF